MAVFRDPVPSLAILETENRLRIAKRDHDRLGRHPGSDDHE